MNTDEHRCRMGADGGVDEGYADEINFGTEDRFINKILNFCSRYTVLTASAISTHYCYNLTKIELVEVGKSQYGQLIRLSFRCNHPIGAFRF